ncbi:MAG: hypothetical protein LAO56_18435 [Acidobacteriia bacterium]|nr:hypothetical protein [Terriglobia bacterium]
MNHDNSRLMYTEYENPEQPLKPQAVYRNAGPVPARGDDASDLAYQQLAVMTAMAARVEWVKKIEENADAKKAIESGKGWNLKTHDPHLATELKADEITQMALSCAAGKWDGDNPPSERGALCRSVLDRRMNSVGGMTGSQLWSGIIGLAANLLTPIALKFTAVLGGSRAVPRFGAPCARHWLQLWTLRLQQEMTTNASFPGTRVSENGDVRCCRLQEVRS